jgi:hypothetical protein
MHNTIEIRVDKIIQRKGSFISKEFKLDTFVILIGNIPLDTPNISE